MMKKIFAVALAGLLTLPFVSTGHAEAAPQPQAGYVKIAYSNLFNPWKLKDGQIPDISDALKKLGIPLDLTRIQEIPAAKPVGSDTSNKTAQPVKHTQPSKVTQPGKSAQPQKPAANNGSKPPAQNTSSGQMNAFEKKVVDLTNQQRAKAGLKPLSASNSALSKMARAKSQDMRDKNYFDHQSPTYGSPFDMMKKYGISFTSAGENIAAGQKTPEEVVNGWMNSPGHRANILNASFTTIGVGYVQGGSYGSYWTQEFIGK